MTFDAQSLYSFRLVGARYSKLMVDEQPELRNGTELDVEITRENAKVSDSKYGERPVIEIKVGMVSSLTDDSNSPTRKVFHVEITAGFVGRSEELDGDLAQFNNFADYYFRGAYWMLRERMDSVFAVTSIRGMNLPWDIVPTQPNPEGKGGVAKPTARKTSKTKARAGTKKGS